MLKRYLTRVFEASEVENREEIMRAVRGLPAAGSMLDLGCYDGRYTVQLAAAARCSDVHGVEFLAEHAAKARERGVTVAEADLNAPLPYPDGSFDLVHANQVIEHLKGTDLFVSECARVCRPGGTVVLSTNNMASWHNVLSLTLGMQPFPNHVSDRMHVGNPLNPRDGVAHVDAGQTHLRIFVGRALARLAELHGLRVRRMAVSGYYPLPPAAARLACRVDPLHAAFLIGVFERPAGRA